MKARDVAAQVEQGVHLHRRLGGAEMSHGKTDRHRSMVVRIQGVDRIGQVETKILRAYSFLAWAINRWARSA